MAQMLEQDCDLILSANEKDLKDARANGISDVMEDRLMLSRDRVFALVSGVRAVASLDDPVGGLLYMKNRPNGLKIGAKRVPLGVIGMIYESRPNVTADSAALCLKAGNSVILRGGHEAIHSNIAIALSMRRALSSLGLDENIIQILSDTTREAASAMMRLNSYIDVLIPRGGAGLIRAVLEQSTVPVIETGVGNCHIYVDESADLKMAVDILYNAKCSRPSVCNAAESLLVHKNIAEVFLPMAFDKLSQKHVELRGCERTRTVLGPSVIRATEEDYKTEFLDYILSIKVVDSLDEAIDHINRYGTGHSEAIVTSNYFSAERFLDLVDAAAVYVNASTRFTDGGEFGLGAEIGISTQKLHARGPMGIEALTTIKYVIYGSGQIR